MKKTITTILVIALVVIIVGVTFKNKNRETADNGYAPTLQNGTKKGSTPPNDNSGAKMETGTTIDLGVKDKAVQSEKTFIISGKNFSFTPNAIEVSKGDKVTIVFKNDGGTHNLVIEEFNVGTPLVEDGKGSTISFVADKTGSFQYYCSVGSHRLAGMWGTLTVK